MPNDKCLADLPCAVNNQDFIGIGLKIVFYIGLDFPIQHTNLRTFQQECRFTNHTFQSILYHVFRTMQQANDIMCTYAMVNLAIPKGFDKNIGRFWVEPKICR